MLHKPENNVIWRKVNPTIPTWFMESVMVDDGIPIAPPVSEIAAAYARSIAEENDDNIWLDQDNHQEIENDASESELSNNYVVKENEEQKMGINSSTWSVAVGIQPYQPCTWRIFWRHMKFDKMKSLKNLRDAIIRAHERGKKQVEIGEFLGISTSTVNDAIKRYKETGNNEDRKGRDRKKTARSRKNVQCAKGMIKRNPTTRANSTRKLAKKK